jgi:hypothetical protein
LQQQWKVGELGKLSKRTIELSPVFLRTFSENSKEISIVLFRYYQFTNCHRKQSKQIYRLSIFCCFRFHFGEGFSLDEMASIKVLLDRNKFFKDNPILRKETFTAEDEAEIEEYLRRTKHRLLLKHKKVFMPPREFPSRFLKTV